MKIDVYPHIIPQDYLDRLDKKSPSGYPLSKMPRSYATLTDLELRFRMMDQFEGLVQVLTLGSPAIEAAVGPEGAAELSIVANDSMAELVAKYPYRFAGAVACLPMNNIGAALKEIDRAIVELRFRGIQLYTSINGVPLDHPDFRPIYEKMADYNLPIWLHPRKDPEVPEYPTEDRSKYHAFSMFSWPYETSLAMGRLVFSGILEDYPNLKFITHHCGGMVPFFGERIRGAYDTDEVILKRSGFPRLLRHHPIEYFRRFYNDTAVYGSTPALMCGYSFFGGDHLLFGTDFPYDSQIGMRYLRDTIRSIEQMDITPEEKTKIFEGNARSLLRLPT